VSVDPRSSKHTLRRKIKLGILAALDQRIALRYALAPMTAVETAGYVKHPLVLAAALTTSCPTTRPP
jgi:type II secretory pathway predicted ATPase ExeA